MMQKHIDHVGYPAKLKLKTKAELEYIITDAQGALDAYPENPNAGYYADEINYAQNELASRRKKPKIRTLYGVRYYPDNTSYSKYLGYKGQLLPYRRAMKLVKWLKSKGVDAFTEKFTIKD